MQCCWTEEFNTWKRSRQRKGRRERRQTKKIPSRRCPSVYVCAKKDSELFCLWDSSWDDNTDQTGAPCVSPGGLCNLSEGPTTWGLNFPISQKQYGTYLNSKQGFWTTLPVSLIQKVLGCLYILGQKPAPPLPDWTTSSFLRVWLVNYQANWFKAGSVEGLAVSSHWICSILFLFSCIIETFGQTVKTVALKLGSKLLNVNLTILFSVDCCLIDKYPPKICNNSSNN